MNIGSSLLIVALLLLSIVQYEKIQVVQTSDYLASSIQDTHQDDAKAAAQVAEKLFAAMKAKDGEAIRSLFLKDGQLVDC